jgi:hypothetical protein
MKFAAFLTASLTFLIPLSAQNDDGNFKRAFDNINKSVLKSQLGFLASDWTEGRETGSKGELLASDYIASILELYGVKPGGDNIRTTFTGLPAKTEKSWFQNYSLLKTSPGETQEMKIKSVDGNMVKTRSLVKGIDFSVNSVNQDVEIEAPVTFIGYGFKSEKLHYDDFSKLDLKGRFVLKIAGVPGFARKELSQAELAAALRESESVARRMGAAGIIEINPSSLVAGTKPVNMMPDPAPSESGPFSGLEWADYSLPGTKSTDDFLYFTITLKTADEILKGTGFELESYVRKMESQSVVRFPELKSKRIFVKLTVKSEIVRARNVIGVIEGKNPDQVIVVGAHYDHLGIHNGYIWNGADDNGSGTVGVMTIAKAIMETRIKPDKTIIIALWSAEEEGLLGSRYYVGNIDYPLRNLRLNVNLDMISRYISDNEQNKVNMIYTESYDVFRTITEQNLRDLGIDLDVNYQPSNDPPGGSDHRSFVAAGIPIMRFKPGHRELYHTPGDEVTTLNWDIMEKIVRITFSNIWYLANNNW